VEVYEGDLTAALVVKPPFAIGTGRTAALGAMKAGATARQAVEIAAQIDVYTGGKITSYSR
jgi:ATP-dependent protease HslVU (ClpYQ) peptidase subunit